MNENEKQLRPAHYGGDDNPFEPIKIIDFYDLNFNMGNIIKYALRDKGNTVDDLKKIITYAGFELKKYYKVDAEDTQSKNGITNQIIIAFSTIQTYMDRLLSFDKELTIHNKVTILLIYHGVLGVRHYTLAGLYENMQGSYNAESNGDFIGKIIFERDGSPSEFVVTLTKEQLEANNIILDNIMVNAYLVGELLVNEVLKKKFIVKKDVKDASD